MDLARGREPEECVDLTTPERLAVLCSTYGPRPEELLRRYVGIMAPDDWAVTESLLYVHGLAPHLWFHLRSVVDDLPLDVANDAMTAFRGSVTRDEEYAKALVELCAELSRAGISFANMKGIFLRRWLYEDSAPPRGSSDLDLLVFGGHEGMARTMMVMRDLGYTPKDPETWEALWSRVADYSLERMIPTGRICVEPHRAPASIFLEGRGSETLLRWLEDGVRPLGNPPLPSLSPEGHLVVLAIKLFSDAMPTLRMINDVAMLAVRHGATLDWDEVERIARRCHLGDVVPLALDLARCWRKIPRFVGEPKGRRHATLEPYLEVPGVLRGPKVGPFGDARQPAHLAFLLAFGWRTGVRGWFAIDRINHPHRRQSGSLTDEMTYWLTLTRGLRTPLRRLVERRGWSE